MELAELELDEGAAESELSLSCVLLSNGEAFVSKVSRNTCKSWNVQYAVNDRTWNNIIEDSVSLYQQCKIAGLWDSPELVLWNSLSKQLK